MLKKDQNIKISTQISRLILDIHGYRNKSACKQPLRGLTCAGGDVSGLSFSSKTTSEVMSRNAGGIIEILLLEISKCTRFFSLLTSAKSNMQAYRLSCSDKGN